MILTNLSSDRSTDLVTVLLICLIFVDHTSGVSSGLITVERPMTKKTRKTIGFQKIHTMMGLFNIHLICGNLKFSPQPTIMIKTKITAPQKKRINTISAKTSAVVILSSPLMYEKKTVNS
mmetsp:Transcript_25940/g.34451  ORF Transcript_25940/g.34451 Transcript_25940/m.34451 type:complete len:120 (+) Transcript_25940:206-565(+)